MNSVFPKFSLDHLPDDLFNLSDRVNIKGVLIIEAIQQAIFCEYFEQRKKLQCCKDKDCKDCLYSFANIEKFREILRNDKRYIARVTL